MVKIKKIIVTDLIAKYEYFPEQSGKSGIVTLDRVTDERVLEKLALGYGKNYAVHAFRRIEEFQKQGVFLEEDIVMWY